MKQDGRRKAQYKFYCREKMRCKRLKVSRSIQTGSIAWRWVGLYKLGHLPKGEYTKWVTCLKVSIQYGSLALWWVYKMGHLPEGEYTKMGHLPEGEYTKSVSCRFETIRWNTYYTNYINLIENILWRTYWFEISDRFILVGGGGLRAAEDNTGGKPGWAG